MKSRRVANCIFCDDLRAEVGNKFSLMGVFGVDALFPVPAPVVMPKLAIVVWVISELNDIPETLTIRVLAPPERKEIARAEVLGESLIAQKPDEYSQHFTIRVFIPVVNVVFEQAGDLEVMVEVDGEEPFRAGRLGLQFNVDPAQSGLPPPS